MLILIIRQRFANQNPASPEKYRRKDRAAEAIPERMHAIPVPLTP
jgi:hypothetical protein